MNTKVRYPAIELPLPRGRYIRGSFTKMTTVDHKRQPLPENKHHYWVAMAVEKNASGAAEAVNAIYHHARNTYATVAASAGVLQQIDLWLNATAFAWKISDGDTDAGWKGREGAAGCYVIELKSSFPISCLDAASNGQLDPAAFKPGCFIDAYISTQINGEVGSTAGIYINPVFVRWVGEGPHINFGVDPNAVMPATGGPGYRPSAGAAMPAPGQHAAPGQAGPAPGAPAQQAARRAPPPPPPAAATPPAETVEQWNIRHTGAHYDGYAWNVVTGAWDAYEPPLQAGPAATTAGQPPISNVSGPSGYVAPGTAYPSNPAGNGPAGGPAASAHGGPAHHAPSGGPAGSAGPTASPSSYGPGNPPPGVSPAQGFSGGYPGR